MRPYRDIDNVDRARDDELCPDTQTHVIRPITFPNVARCDRKFARDTLARPLPGEPTSGPGDSDSLPSSRGSRPSYTNAAASDRGGA